MKPKLCRLRKEEKYAPLCFNIGGYTIFRLSSVGLTNDKLMMDCYGWVDGSGCAVSGLDNKPQVDGITWEEKKKKVKVPAPMDYTVWVEPNMVTWTTTTNT